MSLKRELKEARKASEKEAKKLKTQDEEDFFAFKSVDEAKFAVVHKPNNKSDEKQDIEARVASKYDRENQYPWLRRETMRIQDVFLFLHNEILDFVEFVSQTPAELEIRRQVVRTIKDLILRCYPDAKVMVFGSTATGLNLPNSDIDLLVYNPQVREHTMISKITDALVRADACRSIDPIKHAKVPIIKLQDKKHGVNVDISFNRTNGVYCVKLVKELLQKYPEMRPLLIVLKCFLKSRQLNEPYHGGVGSFLLTMMLCAFLQRQYKLGETDYMDLGKHLVDFFEFYGAKFNYEDVGISIREEGFFFRKEDRGWQQYDDKGRGRLCLENPQDPEVDIGGSAYNIKRVQRAFQHAYDTLVFNNSNSVSILKLIITSDVEDLKPGWKS